MKIGLEFTEIWPLRVSSGGHIGFSGSVYFPECFHWFYQVIRSHELVYQVSHFYRNVQIYYTTVLHYMVQCNVEQEHYVTFCPSTIWMTETAIAIPRLFLKNVNPREEYNMVRWTRGCLPSVSAVSGSLTFISSGVWVIMSPRYIDSASNISTDQWLERMHETVESHGYGLMVVTYYR